MDEVRHNMAGDGTAASPSLETSWEYEEEAPRRWHREILPAITRHMESVAKESHVLDVGCGAGYLSGELARRGYRVTGFDISSTGIALAAKGSPEVEFLVASAVDPELPHRLGKTFDAIVMIEVIEHVYSTSALLRNCWRLLNPGGVLVVSTPYHGYLKNLVLALVDGFDTHMSPLHENGHVRFWSRATMSLVLEARGFRELQFTGVGRVPWLWKSMVFSAVKPLA